MSSKIVLLLLILTFISCKNENGQGKLALDCASIKELINRDQEFRRTKLQGQFFPKVDSIMKSRGFLRGLDDISSLDENLKSEIWDEAHSLKRPYTESEKSRRDSLWTVQRRIDSLNTLQVIEQIVVFGIDSLNSIDAKCGENSLLIFVHSPEGLKSKVAEVIENNKEGVDENMYRHISWHLNGRKN